jgi:hypothetical protein
MLTMLSKQTLYRASLVSLFCISLASCSKNTDSDAKSALLGPPYSLEYFDCFGKLTSGDTDSLAAAMRGEKSTISLTVKNSTDLEKGVHRISFFSISESTLMSFESYDIGLVDDIEIQFGREKGKQGGSRVFGRLLKGTGYLEIVWDYAASSRTPIYLWRGRCQAISQPILKDMEIASGILEK